MPRLPPESGWAAVPRAIEMRHLNAPTYIGGEAGDGLNPAWFRAPGPVPDDPALHQILLTYASDLSFNDNVVRRHGREGSLARYTMASLDHAIWFHEPVRVDQWLLFAMNSPRASGARGFVTGEMYTREGRHVARLAQEALLRPLGPAGSED